MNKKLLRDQMLSKRATLSLAAIEAASQQITEIFINKYGCYDSFLLYSAIKNEINTSYIAQWLWRKGKTVLYPRVDGNTLLLGVCRNADDLQSGYRGILEPRNVSATKPAGVATKLAGVATKLAGVATKLAGVAIEPISHVQVAVIPAVAFDKANHRLGYGKGYYDRFLATTSIDIKVGVAYEWQLVETVFPEEHDQPVDVVIKSPSLRMGGTK